MTPPTRFRRSPLWHALAFATLAVTTAPLAPVAHAVVYNCPSHSSIGGTWSRRNMWIGSFTPQTISYVNAIGSELHIEPAGATLIDTNSSIGDWQLLDGGAQGVSGSAGPAFDLDRPPVGSVDLGGPSDTAPVWGSNPNGTIWPSGTARGALHGLIIQRVYLRRRASQARRSHALRLAREYFEYRIAGSTDNVIDGVNEGFLTLGGETVAVTVKTQVISPTGRANNDSCRGLYSSTSQGFEVWLRPVIHVFGENLDRIDLTGDLAGDYTGMLQLEHQNLPTRRPVY